MSGQKQNQPLVSIIMNCFNGEKYLKNAIDSVILQTYKSWELIFWDNQSKDQSARIFKNYKDKRLKYYSSESHVEILNKARNSALKKANGDFIAFLDTDDWWVKEKLEKLIPLFNDSEVGLVYGNVWIFFEKKPKSGSDSTRLFFRKTEKGGRLKTHFEKSRKAEKSGSITRILEKGRKAEKITLI